MANGKELTVDADLVRALAALLDENHLTEIEYEVAGRRIRVVRTHAVAPAIHPPAVTVAVTPASGLAAAPAAVEPAGAVKAPMVGTVYLSPSPEAPPFVKLGEPVRDGQTLIIIEAMKVMNHIAAPRAGRVTQILVADGMPVEYGQILLVLE